jgi:hypothetical protein
MTTLLASRDTIGLDSPTLLQDLTTHELDDVLTPLTAEELEMDGGRDWWSWGTEVVGAGLTFVGTEWDDAPEWVPQAGAFLVLVGLFL